MMMVNSFVFNLPRNDRHEDIYLLTSVDVNYRITERNKT